MSCVNNAANKWTYNFCKTNLVKINIYPKILRCNEIRDIMKDNGDWRLKKREKTLS